MIRFFLKNLLKKIVFDKANYLMLFFLYSILMIVLSGFIKSYLDSGKSLGSNLFVPYLNTLNVLVSFVFIFKFPDIAYYFNGEGNREFFHRLKLRGVISSFSVILSGLILGILLLAPMALFIVLSYFIGTGYFLSFIYPLVSLLFLFLFLSSWCYFYSMFFQRKTITVLLTLLTMSIFSFVYEYSQMVNNLLLSKMLYELSITSHLSYLQKGVYRLKDIVYFISWPSALIICLSFFSLKERKPHLRKKMAQKTGVIASIFLLVLFNFIVHKKNITVDFSEYKEMTLSRETVKELGRITSPVSIIVFSNAIEAMKIDALISLMKEKQPLLKVNYINPDIRHDLALTHEITKVPAIYIKGTGERTIYNISEASLTSSLSAVNSLNKETIGIFDDRIQNRIDEKSIQKKFAKYYYETSVLNGAEDFKKFNNILFFVEKDISPNMDSILQDYINSGGNLFIFISPNFNNRYSRWSSFISEYGLTLNNHFVVDQRSSVTGSISTAPVVKSASLFNDLKYRGKLIFPLAATITNISTDQHPSGEYLLAMSSDNGDSWGESDVNEIKSGLNKGKSDLTGPIGLIVASPYYDRGKKLVAISSSSFFDANIISASTNVEYIADLISSRKVTTITQSLTTNMSSIYREKNFKVMKVIANILFIVPVFLLIIFFVVKRKYD